MGAHRALPPTPQQQQQRGAPPAVLARGVRGGRREEEAVLGQHLVVFAHGFQGNQYDLRQVLLLFWPPPLLPAVSTETLWGQVKNALADLFPNADLMLSAANEHDTNSDIQLLGACACPAFVSEGFLQLRCRS